MSGVLVGLGKSTRRGVRRCPKCGTVNGTRALSCKNRTCDLVFTKPEPTTPQQSVGARLVRFPAARSVSSSVAFFRLITNDAGETRTIFSVSQPEEQTNGFIILVQSDPKNKASKQSAKPEEDSLPDPIWPTVSRCYLKGCFRGDQESTKCPHLVQCENATEEVKVAEPLSVKHSVLNQMSISASLKHEIWLCARKNTPLVQRVSKSTMVVKCRPDMDRHPLGYLHMTFDCDPGSPRLTCSCGSGSSLCIHFYACVAVFASHETLRQEFQYFIAMQHQINDDSLQQVIRILGPPEPLQSESMERTNINDILDQNDQDHTIPDNMVDQLLHDSGPFNLPESIQIAAPDGSVHTITISNDNYQEEHMDDSNQRISEHIDDSGQQEGKQQEEHSTEEQVLTEPMPIDESCTDYPFSHWLSGLTEQINETMHYQCSGKPEPIVCQVNKAFFDNLCERMSSETKKRLPNSTVNIRRRDKPPFGDFVKYTWKLVNVIVLKQIFDAPYVSLDLSRRFIWTGEKFELISNAKYVSMMEKKAKKCKRILQDEYKTFLKVGRISGYGDDQVFPFIIEWIPDLWPRTRTGEMTISFQFGHQKNGHLDQEKTNQ